MIKRTERITLFALLITMMSVPASRMFAQTQIFVISGYNGPICPGKSVTLCGPNDFDNFHWSNGETGQCITVSTPGTYSVSATNQNARSKTSTGTQSGIGSIVVEGTPPPPSTISGDG